MSKNNTLNDLNTRYNNFYTITDWKNNKFHINLYIRSLFRIVETLSSVEISSIIDIGCGTGDYTKVFKELDFQVLGIDFSEKAIEKARLKYSDCNFKHQDATNLDNLTSYDLFFVKGFSLFNTKDYITTNKIIDSWAKNLNKNGIIIIQSRTDFSLRSPSNWYFHSESEIIESFNNNSYELTLVFLYSKFQYLFLVPFTGKRTLKIVNWISKKVIIGIFKKPVNYFVFLKRK